MRTHERIAGKFNDSTSDEHYRLAELVQELLYGGDDDFDLRGIIGNQLVQVGAPAIERLGSWRHECEKLVMNGSFVLGYLDLFASSIACYKLKENGVTVYSEGPYNLCIEIKPGHVPIGDTLRQIKTYRQFLSGQYAVVTDDCDVEYWWLTDENILFLPFDRNGSLFKGGMVRKWI